MTKTLSPHPDFDLGGVKKRQFGAELWLSHAKILKIFRLAPSALAVVSNFGGRRAKKHAFLRASFWRTLKYCMRRAVWVNEKYPVYCFFAVFGDSGTFFSKSSKIFSAHAFGAREY